MDAAGGRPKGEEFSAWRFVFKKIGWVRAPASVEMQSHQLRCDEVDRYAQIRSGMLFFGLFIVDEVRIGICDTQPLGACG